MSCRYREVYSNLCIKRSIRSMTPSSIDLCTIFLLGICVAITDSNVSIEVHGLSDTNGSYACNTSVVLNCEITSYTVSMEWRIDGELESNCFFKDCDSYPPFPGHYSFTNDTAHSSIGIFNLTINPLTLSDSGKLFVCSAGSHNEKVTLQVTAENDDFNIYTDTSTMDVSTGCISSNVAVEFIWRKVKVGSANATSIYKTEAGSVLPCTAVCIDSGRIQRKSSLGIEGDTDGDKYTFQVEVKYKNESLKNVVYNFGKEFRLKDDSSQCSIKCDDICILLIVIGICFIIYVIVGCFVLYVMLVVCQTKQGDCKEDKRETTHIEIILNTLSAVLWIVIVILFICSLLRYCSCDVPCCCCEIVLKLLYILGGFFGIHVFFWLILLYVLYKRKDKDDEEGNINFKTKLMKVRIVSSAIPMVGFFPVCGWLIRIYRYENRTIRDKVASEKKTRELPSIPERIVTLNKTEDKKKKSQKKVKKEQNKINELFKQTIDSNEDREEKVKEDQLSASEITIVKPKGTYIKNNANIQKSPDTRSTLTHSVTLQLSQTNRNVQSRSQDHNEEHEKNIPNNQNHGPHADENPQRKIDVSNKQSGSKKMSDSKDEVKPKKRKSRKETDEIKSTKTTEFVITDAHTGNAQVTKTGSDDTPHSRDAESPSDISNIPNNVPNREHLRKNKNGTKGPNNNKPLSAESHNGQIDETNVKSGSKNKSDRKDEVTPKKWNSRKETDENKSTITTEFAATGNKQGTKKGSGDAPESKDADSPSYISKSDNTVPNREKSRTNKKEKDGPNNTKSRSTESHNGSEPMKRALSAIFDDEKDDTPTVSTDPNTKM